MTMEDFVIALEKYVRTVNNNAVFVLQKEVEPCRLKVYKKFRYTLWYIDKSRDKRFPIYTTQVVERVTTPEEEDLIIKGLNIKFMEDLFKYIRGEKFKLILGGSYDGDESILDSTDTGVTA